MAMEFTREEYQARINQVTASLKRDGLDGMLIFRQESMYWLTGYDTAGYSQFQSLWLGADGTLMLLTRSSDLRQAKLTSIIEDIRLWVDSGSASPAETLKREVAEFAQAGAVIGVEFASVSLNAQRGRMLAAAFEPDYTLHDSSHLIASISVVKSESELTRVRRAGAIADEAWNAAWDVCRPGGWDADVLAEIYATVIRAGGDPAAGRFVGGAGEHALLCRYFTGRNKIGDVDQVNIEFGAAYRHYHVCLMRTAVMGQPSLLQQRMQDANVEALLACKATLRPGNTYGDLFDAHTRVLDGAGFRNNRLNACGYSLGVSYPPTWMEWPMIFHGNDVALAPGMVVFMHMIQLDSDTGTAMCLGETYIVTEGEPERLSALSLNLPNRAGR
ncbi:MAG: Xaa-Pro peptidase family protein [Thalassobaculaceae bacterium]|nr:Xaa-Pro peptidase family protein [Thalassobaculaceae bacterium]